MKVEFSSDHDLEGDYMRVIKRFRPSPAMVIACLALLLALGGTGYAAIKLPKNSVTTVQVKDFSLLSRDFKRGQLPAGAAGPTGPTGPAGPAGPAGASGSTTSKWALVRPDGGIVAQSGGITLAAKPSAGTYILSFGSAVTGKPILASAAYAADASDQRGATSAGPCSSTTEGRTCPTSDNTSTAYVQTRSSAGSPADHAFYIVVIG
ncbi:MAG: hypothetical protein QOE13_2113 [Gaiellaceae bacterium]|nr:hypothetical protein [Gaiellaceae bacterium]